MMRRRMNQVVVLLLAVCLSLSACATDRALDAGISDVVSNPAHTEVPTATMRALPSPTAVTTGTLESSSTSSSEESSPDAPAALPPVYTYEVISEYPHDPDAFTQGLVYLDGVLYEGTGLYGQSSLRKVELETGEPLLQHDLPAQYFGEGIAVMDGTVYQLTWKAQEGFRYNAEDFSLTGEFTYPTEGWGLTHDGERLIMSDGTSYLTMRDPDTFEELNRVEVVGVNGPVTMLNELEYIGREVYANVWQTDWIVRIDPNTGEIVGYIDLTGLLPADERTGTEDVLNGIAYDAENDRLFVTGKLWPKLYEIRLKPME